MNPFRRWTDSLSLRTLLVGGFACLIALLLIVGGSTVYNGIVSRQAILQLVERDARVSDLALRSIAAFLTARRHEKDMLLSPAVFAFDEAKTRYLAPMRVKLVELAANLGEIRRLSEDPQLAGQLAVVETAIKRYEKDFLETVDLLGKLGRGGSGAAGAMDAAADAMQKRIVELRLERLLPRVLALRQWEHEFVLPVPPSPRYA